MRARPHPPIKTHKNHELSTVLNSTVCGQLVLWQHASCCYSNGLLPDQLSRWPVLFTLGRGKAEAIFGHDLRQRTARRGLLPAAQIVWQTIGRPPFPHRDQRF